MTHPTTAGRIYTHQEIILKRTCGACPEQYNAFIFDQQVGYLRLRHGEFYVAFPNLLGEVIYEAEPEGDGCFEDNEREKYLLKARQAIAAKLNECTTQPPTEDKRDALLREAAFELMQWDKACEDPSTQTVITKIKAALGE